MRNTLGTFTATIGALFAAIALVAVAGCHSGDSSQTNARPGASAAKATTKATTKTSGDLARGLQLLHAARDLDGQTVGSAPADKEVTAIIVFASWCGPCRAELAVLGKLRNTEPKLRVIGVNYYEEFDDLSDESKLRSYVADNAPWLQVVRADEALFEALGRPPKIPTLFVFDKQGRLVESFLRAERPQPPTMAELKKSIDRALSRG
ncbi:MAG: TlpA disulfide reductase family protein [Myxococcota bacterium]